MAPVILIDCTLRDGGYYNNWDFPRPLINEYLRAMAAAEMGFIELGFRTLERDGFRGACAYSTDAFISSLSVPAEVKFGVMVNASELVEFADGPVAAIEKMFAPREQSPVTLVRLACHVHEFEKVLPACTWLNEQGYIVGINLMQVADRSADEIETLAKAASRFPIEVLYFADSLGSLDPEHTARIVHSLRRGWKGAIGIHSHDNMGRAVANILRAIDEGATWVDCTVTGMGRGPGNAQTEYTLLELEQRGRPAANLAPLLALVREVFKPMQERYGWGMNPYYHLAGRHGIHPTFIQEMLADARYGEAEILAVIEHLVEKGGKQFTAEAMEDGRQMYGGVENGSWRPAEAIEGRDVLIIGAGPSASAHREGLEHYIRAHRPFVIALNTQSPVDGSLIDIRVACHPFRLLADRDAYAALPQSLVVSVGRLPEVVTNALPKEKLLDFGLTVAKGSFEFRPESAVVPSLLAAAYALAVASSGNARNILLGGFDGYGPEDPRTMEMDALFELYQAAVGAVPLTAITPTRYSVAATSVYAY